MGRRNRPSHDGTVTVRARVAQVADKFLTCGVLEHGVARMRCDDCARAFPLAFSCTCRYFCPSCHAKRLDIRTQWLDTTLLAPVPRLGVSESPFRSGRASGDAPKTTRVRRSRSFAAV